MIARLVLLAPVALPWIVGPRVEGGGAPDPARPLRAVARLAPQLAGRSS